ncbi:MAG: arylsulfatase [Chthoniobacteraceae bacterium]
MKHALVTFTACLFLSAGVSGATADKPNIIFILADDMGLGDVKCLGGETSKIATPHMDHIAKEGMVFSDAHTSSSVCTPTRYSIITGRYNWRSPKKSSVLGGISPPLIEADRPTVARFMKNEGYVTGCIGKWHLGMNMPTTDGKAAFEQVKKGDGGKPLAPKATNIDWKGTITGGPNANGFDYYYGISASLDMAPYIWIHNNKFVGECTIAKAFNRPGPAHADFEAEDVLGIITRKSVEFIQANKDKPMFLYIPFSSPHTPIVPSKKWQGKSGLGAYGDFVMETDWAVGEIVKAVDEAGLAENTLIIVTADNGCSPAARNGMEKIAFNGAKPEPIQPDVHYPSSIYRGHKADLFEGGHRVPFIARWKGKVAAGKTNNETICQVDLYATCAELLGKHLSAKEGPDSVSILPHLLGTANGPLREATVHHSINGSFAIRKGPWKLLLSADSGGWSKPRPGKDSVKGLPPVQLFDLSKDPGETTNLQAEHPEIVAELQALLTRYIKDGRSTPGEKQTNDGPERWRQIDWMK